ncbi:MAG: GlxA family transcriptional regulator [Rhodobacteraceae bacterium]|nr:MAG: GlxA family transcriptional regulator [Paracoccaceae bacterium]
MTAAPRPRPPEPPQGAGSARFVFYLCPSFSMIAFAATIEPLRLANRLSRRDLYAWRLAAEGASHAACSNGARVAVDMGLEDVERGSTVLVCGGVDAHLAATRGALTWLRKQARLGARLGAVCTGSYVLAKAGLLDGRRCTIHWENRAAFAEEFPEIEVSNRVFEIDGDRMTCAGGAAGADMMLDLIAREHGPDLASLVADQMIMAPVRSAADEQRLSVPARIGVRHPKLISIIQRMEDNIEEPVSPSDLARDVGMSTRQLERLFRRYLSRSPKRYYMELRLQKARNLLLQTDMSVINVALACGFTSPSHFSKCYRALFGRTPYRERGAPPLEAG